MEHFARLMTMIIDFLKTPFTLWGYTFSLWGVVITVLLLSIAFWFISEVFSD